MLVLDSEIVIDLANGYPPAIEWLSTIDDETSLTIPGSAMLEMTFGAINKREASAVHSRVAGMPVHWPAPAACDRLLARYIDLSKRDGVNPADLLIAACALELAAPVCTLDKHFRFIQREFPELRIEQPYQLDAGRNRRPPSRSWWQRLRR